MREGLLRMYHVRLGMEHTKLARVTSANIGLLGRGILQISIGLDYRGSCQAYQVCLDEWSDLLQRRVGTAFASEALIETLHFFDVQELSEAVGQAVMVDLDRPGLAGLVTGLRRLECDPKKRPLDFQAILARVLIEQVMPERLPSDAPTSEDWDRLTRAREGLVTASEALSPLVSRATKADLWEGVLKAKKAMRKGLRPSKVA